MLFVTDPPPHGGGYARNAARTSGSRGGHGGHQALAHVAGDVLAARSGYAEANLSAPLPQGRNVARAVKSREHDKKVPEKRICLFINPKTCRVFLGNKSQ